jgi:hypothetical protein
VPGRIAALVPDARLVYLVRHPVERMHSQWIHRTLRGIERRSPRDALLDDVRYLSKSQYALQVEQYLEHFPRERLLIVVTEELRADRAGVMRRVFEFLGVDPSWSGPVLEQEFHQTANKVARPGPPPMPALARRLPGYRTITRRAPAALRRAYASVARPLARGRDPRTVPLPDDLRRELEHRLADDLERFVTFMPPTFDAWGLR